MLNKEECHLNRRVQRWSKYVLNITVLWWNFLIRENLFAYQIENMSAEEILSENERERNCFYSLFYTFALTNGLFSSYKKTILMH